MKLYLAKDGFTAGPFTLVELGKKMNGGEALPVDLVYEAESDSGRWVSILNYYNPVTYHGITHYAIKPQMTNRFFARTAVLRMGQMPPIHRPAICENLINHSYSNK